MGEWVIVQNTVEVNSDSPGRPTMGWIAGEMEPDKYGNRPNWEGPGKRVGLLALHPLSGHEPAKIRFTGRVRPDAPVLCVEVSGNIAGDGDFLLQCVVNGKKIGKYVVDASQWHTCTFDLSKSLGGTNSPNVELWNAGGGKRTWYFEHCYIDRIYFKEGKP